MSIFHYFASKATDEQEWKPSSPTPHKKLASSLDKSSEEEKVRYPDDSETADAFVREELRQAWRSGKFSLRAATEACGIPKSTFRDAVLRVKGARGVETK